MVPVRPWRDPEMTPLEEIIRAQIKAEGPLRLDQYMTLCLTHPQYGYYMSGDPFGAEGDFITAPEVSQMFGELVGAFLADAWIRMKRPGRVILLECGPGRGTLMADALRATRKVAGFHDALEVHLLEASPALRDKQRAAVADFDPRWHDSLDTVPSDAPLLVIGNEFLDALPIRQWERTSAGWRERVIGIDKNDTICFNIDSQDSVVDGVFQTLPEALKAEKPGSVVEVSHEARCFVTRLANMLKKQSGIALFVDYGHARWAVGDTLQAVSKHRYCDVLDSPGQVDLTAHVNFELVREAGEAEGVVVRGPVSQGSFLKRLGIESRAQGLLAQATDQQRRDIVSALHRLTAPEEMGDLFKAMALCHDPDLIPAGF